MGTIESLSEEQVLDLFVDPKHLSIDNPEKKAVARTLGGVQRADEEQWVGVTLFQARVALEITFQLQVFQHLKSSEHADFSEHITASAQITSEGNVERRLL